MKYVTIVEVNYS